MSEPDSSSNCNWLKATSYNGWTRQFQRRPDGRIGASIGGQWYLSDSQVDLSMASEQSMQRVVYECDYMLAPGQSRCARS